MEGALGAPHWKHCPCTRPSSDGLCARRERVCAQMGAVQHNPLRRAAVPSVPETQTMLPSGVFRVLHARLPQLCEGASKEGVTVTIFTFYSFLHLKVFYIKG